MLNKMQPAADFQLHCRTCGAGFWEMVDLLNHRDRCGQPKPTRRKPKKRARVSRG
jgi:hypothetical protein